MEDVARRTSSVGAKGSLPAEKNLETTFVEKESV